MPQYPPEAIAARQAMVSDPEFNDLSGAEKRQALQELADRFKPKAVTVPPASQSTNLGNVAPSPAVIPKPLPQAPRQQPQQGPLPSNPTTPGPIGNALLTGYRNMQSVSSRDTLPPEFDQSLNPVPSTPKTFDVSGHPLTIETNPLQALAFAPPLAEQTAAMIGMSAIPGAGAAGPMLAVGGLGAARYGKAVEQGQMSRPQAAENLIADVGTAGLMTPVAHALHGNTIPQFLGRNLAQTALQSGSDYAMKGIDPTLGGLVSGFALGAGLDAGTGNMPKLPEPGPKVSRRTAQAGAIDYNASSEANQRARMAAQPYEPAVPGKLYHGTAEDFTQFDPAKAGTNRDSGWFGTGAYVTEHPELAAKYGPRVLDVASTASNPYVWPKDAGNVRTEAQGTKPLPSAIRDEVMAEYAKRAPSAETTQGWDSVGTQDEGLNEKALSDSVAAVLTRKGHDSVVYDHPMNPGQKEYAILDTSKASFGGGRPPVEPPAAAPSGAEPPKPPSNTTAAGAADDSRFPATPPTPEMQRVYGDGVENLKNEPRAAVKEVASILDRGAPRPESDPAAVTDALKQTDKYLNEKKVSVSGDTLDSLRQRVAEVVAERGWNPKERIGFDEIRAKAAAISPEVLKDLKPPAKGETISPELWRAASEHIDALSQEIQTKQEELNAQRGTLTADEISQREEVIDRMDNDVKRLLDVTIPTRSQNGRNLAYHKIVNQGSFSTEYWLSRAQKAAGQVPMDNAAHQRIRDLTVQGQRLSAVGDTAGADAVRLNLAKELTAMNKSTASQIAVSVIKAGLLTGPKTHLRNLLGNGAFQVMEEAARLPASLVDMSIGAFTGKRTTQGANAAALYDAAVKGGAKGWKEAGEIMRHGATDAQMQKFMLPMQLNSGSKILDGYVNGVFRLLSAEDRVFKSVAIRRSLTDQARVQAINEAKAGTITGKEVRARAAELVSKPTDTMSANAIAAADEITFNNDNKLADKVNALKHGNPLAEMVMPFVKTPMNILARLLDYIPGAGATYRTGKAINARVQAKALFSALSPEEQRGVSMAIGRGAVGFGMILLGYKLAEKGVMTGVTSRDDAGRRDLNEAANRGDSSVLIGDRWYGIGPFVPGSSLLSIGATLYQEGNKPLHDPAKRVMNMAAVGTRIMLDQPMMQGLSGVKDALDNPGNGGARMAAGLAGELVPTAVSDVAGLADDKRRVPSGPLEMIQSKIPGTRNLLPSKTDAFGREIQQEAVSAIDPTGSKPALQNSDPIMAELVRLNVPVNKAKDVIELPDAKTGKRVPTKLTVDQVNEMRKATGDLAKQVAGAMIADPDYQAMTDDQKRESLQHILTRVAGASNRQMKAKLLEAAAQ